MKYSNNIILTLSLIVGLGVQSCSQEDKFAVQDEFEKIIIKASDSGIQSHDPNTRSTTENYITSFTVGDQIGLFAVRSGAVLNAINNEPVTYSSEGWESLPYTSDLEGATYYAYYPYSSNVKDLFDASKSDPFEDVVAGWVIGADQSNENYMKYDLMTASAAPMPSGRSFNLVFTFAHRMSLAIVQLPFANIKYEFTNEGIDDYVIASSSSDATFELNNSPVTPYFDSGKREFRILVKPGAAANFSGAFVYNGENTKTYQTSIASPTAKTYYNFIIDGGNLGEKIIPHTLKIGDRFYSDGMIEAVGKVPATLENCVGFVVFVGNVQPSVLYPGVYTAAQDVLLREHPKCTHGTVLGLKQYQGRFASTKTCYINTWFPTSVLYDSYISTWGGTTSTINSDGAIGGTHILGYNNTRVIEEYTNITGNTEFPLTFTNLNNFSNANPIPDYTTGWYIPSVYELRILAQLNGDTSLATCNNYLSQYGGVTFIISRYWSSTEANETNEWCINVTGDLDAPAVAYYRTDKTNNSFYSRYFFAF